MGAEITSLAWTVALNLVAFWVGLAVVLALFLCVAFTASAVQGLTVGLATTESLGKGLDVLVKLAGAVLVCWAAGRLAMRLVAGV